MTISKITDREAVLSALAEYRRLGRATFLEKYGYSKSREFMLRDPSTGDLFDSKAIVGVAHGFQFPEIGHLKSPDFSGGEATVESLLRALGFEVVRIGQEWSDIENAQIIDSYFKMLAWEVAGEKYKKSEANEELRKSLKARSKASVELKHQNISAILDLAGLPYIQGYKPRFNFQSKLQDDVLRFISGQTAQIEKIVNAVSDAILPGEQKYTGVLVDTPHPEQVPLNVRTKRQRIPKKLDYVARDERNRLLGRNGESWTIEYENFRLTACEREDLVAKIDWLSERLGDGAGYDISSFEEDGLSRFIEVKTTNAGSLTPFIVTRNELEFSKEVEDAFCLYRLFDFSKSPQLYILRGDIQQHVNLEPVDYRARLKALA